MAGVVGCETGRFPEMELSALIMVFLNMGFVADGAIDFIEFAR